MNDFVQSFNSNITIISFLLGGTAVLSLGISIYAVSRLAKLSKISQVFFQGKDASSLEEAILKSAQDLKTLDRDIQELYDISNKINNLAQRSLHRVGLVRFNPFKDIGGDQSFSLAVLDGKNSGFTLSSLHTREGTRVYVKPINKGQSQKYTLTDEEIKAIKIASLKKDENVSETV